MRWYVVHVGLQTGVFSTWEAAHAQVDGVKGACYQCYNSRDEEMEAFYGRKQIKEDKVTPFDLKPKLMRTSSTITRWQRRNKKGPAGPVVVGRRPCEPLNNPTLLSLGGGSDLKRESHPSPIRLVF